MTTFATRAVLLFALAATIPVVLTAVVWLVAARSGAGVTTSGAELARVRIDELATRRGAAVARLCRDDLAVDALLEQRAAELRPDLDYDRLFRGLMQAAGLDVLWVVDATSGELLATGHRESALGHDGSELARRAREAHAGDFALLLGGEEHQRFIVRTCSIARGGAELSVIGGHRLSTLREADPKQIFVSGEARDGDVVLAELVDSDEVSQGVVVWRSRIDRRAPPLLLWIASVVVLSIGLALLFGRYLNRWIQSSVDDLTAAATRIGRGDFDTTLRDDARSAFPATATAFNKMTRDLRDARAQLRQTERAAAWQEIARSLAHELKNPLSPIRLSIETLRKAHARSHEEFDTLFDESTRTILQEVDRLRHIVDEFSRFARLPSPKLRTTDLRETVSQAATLHAEGESPVTLALPSDPVEARVDPDQMTQVLHNLLQNARDAASDAHPHGGGSVSLSVEKRAGTIYIRVVDNGSGIASDQAGAIFEPYYTRKEGGTGLGLAITQRIVAEHGGRIDLESEPGRTVFTVVLPGL